MTSKIERLAALYKENGSAYCLPDEVELMEEGEFTQDHKIQFAEHIVKFEDEFFGIQETRTGSYHTDWFYEDTEIVPVERKEETKVVVSWKATGKGVTVPGRF